MSALEVRPTTASAAEAAGPSAKIAMAALANIRRFDPSMAGSIFAPR
jgi:hypothetical protein